MRKEILVKTGLGLGGVVLAGAGGILVDRVFLNPGPASVDGGAVRTPTPVVTPGVFATVTPDGARLATRTATPIALETAVARAVSIAVAEVKPAATVVPIARPTVAIKEQVSPDRSTRFPVPTDFRPETQGGVKNYLLEQAPKGVWFHPMTQMRSQGNKERVWSYDYYYLDISQKLDLVQHGGEEGRLIFRQNHGETARLVLGVGRMTSFTDSAGKQHDLRSNVQGGPAMINIRTHPNVLIRAYNPDTGERLMMGGKPVELTTSESGDAGFVLGNCGRGLFVADLPVDVGLETMVWEGPYDRQNLKLNIVDITAVLAANCLPNAK